MILSHDPLTDPDLLQLHFAVTPLRARDGPPAWGDGRWAPCIVPSEPPQPGQAGQVVLGLHGLHSPAAPHLGTALPATHCRVETMKSAPACRESWWAGRRCVIPAQRVRAWRDEMGRLTPWHIEAAGAAPLGLAGLWRLGATATGEPAVSFALLTLPADGHGVFGPMEPGAGEHRMPAILPTGAHRAWLFGSLKEAEALLRPCPAEALRATPQDLPGGTCPLPATWAKVPDMFAPEWHALAAEHGTQRPTRGPRGPRAQRLAVTGPTTADLF